MLKSVLDYLENSERKYPDKPAVVDEQGTDTYRQLAHSARAVGTGLVERGLRPNMVVAVMIGKNRKALSAFWGITYAGGIYAPMDCGAPAERLRKIFEVLCPAYVLTDAENAAAAAQLVCGEQILYWEELTDTKPDEDRLTAIQKRRIDVDPLYIICTSGSTGVPKGVVISHRAVIDFTEESSEVMDFSEKESFANQAPFYFDASVPDLYCTIRNSATLHIIPEKWFSFPIRVLEYIRKEKINAIFWVPSALIVTANLRALPEVDVTCLKKIMFCGEVMPVKQYNMWKKYVPDAVYVNYYGPSETTYASTYYIIDRNFSPEETLPIGNAAVNTDVLILNECNRECERGEIGELCIRGSGVALGYYNNPEKTEEAFVQNPLTPFYRDIMYRTGDLVKRNERDEIMYVGRRDFQIKHMGYRIEMGEIEAAVMGIDQVQRACCIYNRRKQTIILLYAGTISSEQVKEEVKEKVPAYMVPGIIKQLDQLPMNANGKVDRRLLGEQYGG